MTKSNENEKAAAPAPASKDADKGSLWDALTKGSKCLAKSTEPDEDGYYLAIVEEVSADGATLVCRWAMYPKLGTFKTRRLAVGLLTKAK